MVLKEDWAEQGFFIVYAHVWNFANTEKINDKKSSRVIMQPRNDKDSCPNVNKRCQFSEKRR